MANRIVLPQLLSFRLTGFKPIFDADLSLDLQSGPNIILGGNGLGKTTIMQAIVYGLTGGDLFEETEKSQRWDHKYFRKRLAKEQLSIATVEVGFGFGKTTMSVLRGFYSSNVLAFRVGTSKKTWVTDQSEAAKAFESALREYGGYQKTADFSLVVHRLLYLPETRRLLAWDTDSQMRILMLLNQDVLPEEEFHRRREILKELDSNRRHTHVVLNKLDKLQQSMIEESDDESESESDEVSLPEEDFHRLVSKLQDTARTRNEIEEELNEVIGRLSEVSTETEALRESVEQCEASLIAGLLSDQEKESSLAVHKMATNGICPVCGIRQETLRTLALEHLNKHLCLLCGSKQPSLSDLELTTLHSQLAEKLRSQQSLESKCRTLQARFELIRRQEDRFQFEVSKARYTQPVLTLIERDLPPTSGEDVKQTKAELIKLELDLLAQIKQRQRDLERDYKRFRGAVENRISQLRKAYEAYATDFLGIQCELEEVQASELFNFTRFIPRFNNIDRETPDSCSEAQRFFLDIAYRMALIDSTSKGNKGTAIFICETPESALDISYVNNVVQMFDGFTNRGHSLLLTANIQSTSIAGNILKPYPKSERQKRVLNLLDFGQLSKVHKNAITKLKGEVRKIMG
jgi:DNA repair exonuclease SbcCD ATPase subunit